MRTLGLFLAVLGLTATVYAQRINFAHVSGRKGLQRTQYKREWRPETNKYYGGCVFDADGDGYYDLLLPNHNQKTEFYWGGPDGFRYDDPREFTDVHGVGAADFDGDGDEDFIITRGGANGSNTILPKILKTNGAAQSFRKVENSVSGFTEPIRGRSLAFFDVDGDGDRDLLLVNRHKIGARASHFIYENLGNGRFRKQANVGFQETKAAWFCLVDLDKNDYLDVLLMGFGFVEVWMGQGRFRFKKENWRLPGADTLNSVRGCAEIDVDGDGDMEIYMPRGDQSHLADDRLYKVRSGRLVDISARWNVPKGGRHSHVTNLDVDNNGRMDLYVSVRTYYKTDRRRDILLYNTGSKFKQILLRNTGLHVPYVPSEDGDSAVAFDYNNDGRTDILVGPRNNAWRLYENRSPRRGNNWVRINVGRPRMGRFNRQWNRDPWGALVVVSCGSKKFVQRTGTPGMSHSASNILRLTFGIGKCRKVSKIQVDYIGGVRTIKFGRKVNREIKTGMVNCPGRKCVNSIRPCAPTCARKPCELNIRNGKKMYCTE